MREEWDNQMVICDGLEDYLYERIIDAYKMGMSVIEISRVIAGYLQSKRKLKVSATYLSKLWKEVEGNG